MKNIYEIFDEVANSKTAKDRVLVLQFNQSYALKSVLKGMFDPNVQFVFDDVPPYKSSAAPPGLGYNNLHQEMKKVYLFVKDDPRASPNLTMRRREQLLIQLLESLESKEAEVFANMIRKKKNAVKGLTYGIVKEAFPDILA